MWQNISFPAMRVEGVLTELGINSLIVRFEVNLLAMYFSYYNYLLNVLFLCDVYCQ